MKITYCSKGLYAKLKNRLLIVLVLNFLALGSVSEAAASKESMLRFSGGQELSRVEQ